MRFPLRAVRSVFVGFAAASTFLQANDAPTAVRQHASPLPAVVALARSEHIALDGLDPAGDTGKLRPGDTLTALFTLTDGGRVRQWLGEVKIVPLSTAEQNAPLTDTAIYTGAGSEFHLTSPPAAYALRLFGPITDSPAPRAGWPVKQARFTLRDNAVKATTLRVMI